MKKFWGLLIILLFSFWAIRPLFIGGFFPMHDNTQVARVYEMAKALRDGQFPVRWVPDLGYGYGYPIFNFYSPLPYYIGAIFVILGLDALVATKLMFAVGILTAGIFMYLLAREFWGEAGGAISGLFLMYAPYHAVQIYVRGAVGEFWALSFLPLTVWGFYKLTVEPKWRWVVMGSIGYAAVILSHNITAMILTLLLISFIILLIYPSLRNKNFSIIYHLTSTIFLGFALSAFFWLPAILEAKFVNIGSLISGTNNFRLHFLCFWQLWNSAWGYGGSAPGCDLDGMSFKIGKLHILMATLAFLIAVWRLNKDKFKSKIIILATCYLLFAIFMTLEISKPIWEVLPFMAYIQYPWRFLVFIIFFVSFMSGAVFLFIKNKRFKVFAFCFLLFALLVYNIKYFRPQTYLDVDADYYTNEEALKWRTSKLSDEYLPKDFPKPKNKEEIATIIGSLQLKPPEYNFKANTPTRIFANLVSLAALIFLTWRVLYARKKEC